MCNFTLYKVFETLSMILFFDYSLVLYFTLDTVYKVKKVFIMIQIRTTQSGHFAFIS